MAHNERADNIASLGCDFRVNVALKYGSKILLLSKIFENGALPESKCICFLFYIKLKHKKHSRQVSTLSH